MRSKPCACTRGDPRGTWVSFTHDEKLAMYWGREGQNPEPSYEVPLCHAFVRSVLAQTVPGSGNSVVSNSSRRYEVTDEVNAWGQPAFKRRRFTCAEIAPDTLLSLGTRVRPRPCTGERNFQARSRQLSLHLDIQTKPFNLLGVIWKKSR